MAGLARQVGKVVALGALHSGTASESASNFLTVSEVVLQFISWPCIIYTLGVDLPACVPRSSEMSIPPLLSCKGADATGLVEARMKRRKFKE